MKLYNVTDSRTIILSYKNIILKLTFSYFTLCNAATTLGSLG